MPRQALTLIRRILRGCTCGCNSCRNGQCGMCLNGPAH